MQNPNGRSGVKQLNLFCKELNVLVFRPQANAQRMVKSAERMCIPVVSEELFMSAMTELLRIDQDWVPSKAGDGRSQRRPPAGRCLP